MVGDGSHRLIIGDEEAAWIPSGHIARGRVGVQVVGGVGPGIPFVLGFWVTLLVLAWRSSHPDRAGTRGGIFDFRCAPWWRWPSTSRARHRPYPPFTSTTCPTTPRGWTRLSEGAEVCV